MWPIRRPRAASHERVSGRSGRKYDGSMWACEVREAVAMAPSCLLFPPPVRDHTHTHTATSVCVCVLQCVVFRLTHWRSAGCRSPAARQTRWCIRAKNILFFFFIIIAHSLLRPNLLLPTLPTMHHGCSQLDAGSRCLPGSLLSDSTPTLLFQIQTPRPTQVTSLEAVWLHTVDYRRYRIKSTEHHNVWKHGGSWCS